MRMIQVLLVSVLFMNNEMIKLEKKRKEMCGCVQNRVPHTSRSLSMTKPNPCRASLHAMGRDRIVYTRSR